MPRALSVLAFAPVLLSLASLGSDPKPQTIAKLGITSNLSRISLAITAPGTHALFAVTSIISSSGTLAGHLVPVREPTLVSEGGRR